MRNRMILTLIALLFCMSIMPITAFAQVASPPSDDAQSAAPATSANQTPAPNETGAGGQENAYEEAIPTPPNTAPPTTAPEIPPSNPFTPPGTGTVVDNATDGDGKEFFTIMTEDGNVFFLVIDRQRNADNVYLLNAVTEEDLLSLAQQGGRPGNDDTGTINAIPPIEQPKPEIPDPPETPEEPEVEQTESGIGRFIPIIVVVVGVGGAAYYFKIVKGKRNDADDELYDDEDDTYEDEDDPMDVDIDDEDYDYEPEDEDDEV